MIEVCMIIFEDGHADFSNSEYIAFEFTEFILDCNCRQIKLSPRKAVRGDSLINAET